MIDTSPLVTLFQSWNQFYRAECITVSGFLLFKNKNLLVEMMAISRIEYYYDEDHSYPQLGRHSMELNQSDCGDAIAIFGFTTRAQ